MKTFVAVMNMPSPYRLHLFNVMWRELEQRGIGFHVHFMSHGHPARPKSWTDPQIEFPHTYWRNWGTNEHHFNPGLVLHLIFEKYTWTWNGSPYDTFTGILAALFGRCPNKIAGAEGNTKTPGIMTGFVGWFKHLIYSRCSFAASPGSDAVKFMAMHQSHTRMKMPKPVIIPNLVDETRFLPREKWPADSIAERRKAMGIDSDDVRLCLIPARLTQVKGLVPFVELLDAEILKGWKVIILGQGPLKDNILNVIRQRNVERHVSILDYVSYDEMPLYYAASDMLLIPSIYDPNPLIVPEALFSGLPIALTCQAGNLEEGVTEGKNGWALPVMNAVAFRKKLEIVFNTPLARLREMGRCSLENNAAFWRSQAAVKHFLDGVGAVAE